VEVLAGFAGFLDGPHDRLFAHLEHATNGIDG